MRLRQPARWEWRPHDPAACASLEKSCGLSPLLARILSGRGFTEREGIDDFLNPALAGIHNPFLLKNMDRAIARIAQAVERGEPIVIYGDYDVDGITATAIVRSTFEFLNVPVQTYIPHRLNEGYGLRADSIRQLAAQGAKLIITVDNGTTAVEEIELARSLGVDVIVTDHHELGGEACPAYALINPKQPGCEYPFKELCGAGVAFKLAHAMLKKNAADATGAREFLKSLLDLVALGTVADIVPLRGENRCFVTHGIQAMRRGTRLGFQSLLDVVGLDRAEVDAGRLAYAVAPRLNAAGRTEHAEYALELLFAKEPAAARELASLLDRFNEDRRRIEFDITEEAFSMIDEESDSPVIVVDQEGWHLGVVGIVASRILERYYRPVVVLGVDGEWAKGSARSVRGFDIHAALTACQGHLEQFGGHAMAAGLRLRASAVADFRGAMDEYARTILTDHDLVPHLTIDAFAGPEDLTQENVLALEGLQPFGAGNPKPLLALDGLSLIEEPRVVKAKHLKLSLAGRNGKSFGAIGFSMADRAEELKRCGRQLRLAATPTINRWGGQARVELEFKDFMVQD